MFLEERRRALDERNRRREAREAAAEAAEAAPRDVDTRPSPAQAHLAARAAMRRPRPSGDRCTASSPAFAARPPAPAACFAEIADAASTPVNDNPFAAAWSFLTGGETSGSATPSSEHWQPVNRMEASSMRSPIAQQMPIEPRSAVRFDQQFAWGAISSPTPQTPSPPPQTPSPQPYASSAPARSPQVESFIATQVGQSGSYAEAARAAIEQRRLSASPSSRGARTPLSASAIPEGEDWGA